MKVTLLITTFLLNGLILMAQPQPCSTSYTTILSTTRADGQPLPLPPDPSFDPPSPPPSGDRRGIYWVHGLGGDQDSWAKAALATDIGNSPTAFPAYKTIGVSMGRYIQVDIPTAGDDLIDDMPTYDNTMLSAGVPDFYHNFVIAHSQGGIVSRQADKSLAENWPPELRRFYGLTTFGSPHGGAQIVNSRDDGRIQAFTTDACNAVLHGAAADLFTAKPLVGFFLAGQINNGINDLCDVFPNALPFVMKNLYAGSTLDFQIGAPVLGELNGFDNADLHKAAFSGIEYTAADGNTAKPKQLFWRTMSSFNNTNALPTFTADEDNDLVNWAATLRAEYLSKEQMHDLNAIFISTISPAPCNWLDWILHSLSCAQYDQAYWNEIHLRNAYRDGIEWLDNVDDQWKIIIGAVDYEEEILNVSGEQCVCLLSPPNSVYAVINGVNSVSACTHYASTHNGVEYCDWVETGGGIVVDGEWVYKESDGVVVRESADGWPGAPTSNRMEMTNHFQMRNSSETQKALTKLYNGFAGDTWFTTEKQ